MHAFPLLDTQRLHLREIQMDDAPQLLAIHGDAQAMKWFGRHCDLLMLSHLRSDRASPQVAS
jgi:RimJ/RimL family protein N-acetyltransferase